MLDYLVTFLVSTVLMFSGVFSLMFGYSFLAEMLGE